MKTRILLFLIISFSFINCSKDDSPSLNSDNKILSFKIEYNGYSYNGIIDDISKTITINTKGLEKTNLIVPIIEISPNASLNPEASVAVNFNEIVTYTVTAENEDKAVYSVIINNTPFSDEKKILSFSFQIEEEIYTASIDHEKLTVKISTYKNVSNITPIITLSENATISSNSLNNQDFSNNIEYIVTAEDGSKNIYTIIVKKIELTNSVKKCYIRARSSGTVKNFNIENPNVKLFLENDTNSYEIEFFDISFIDNNGTTYYFFNFIYTENIQTANDYKLRFKVDDKIKAETEYLIDVLAENAPKILSSDKNNYDYYDTLILKGNNLPPQLRIHSKGVVYQYRFFDIKVNSDHTELEIELKFYALFFNESPKPTRIQIYSDGRYGDSIVVNFN